MPDAAGLGEIETRVRQALAGGGAYFFRDLADALARNPSTPPWVLREAARVPAVLQWSDNWRQLEVLADCDVISTAFKDDLISACRELRDLAHGRSLENAGNLAPRGTAADSLIRPAAERRVARRARRARARPAR